MADEASGNEPWFVFAIEDADEAGVEISKLTRLLGDLSSSFYAIARAKTGLAGPRPGRRALAEEMLAAVRLVRVTPGSTTIEFAPPPGTDQLSLLDEPTPNDVVLDFYEEIGSIERGDPPAPDRASIRRFVRATIADAAEIGTRAEILFVPRPPARDLKPLQRSFPTRAIPEEKPSQVAIRKRRLSGHAYMVDVEPGRQRLRIKLPDGRDLTLEVDDQMAAKMPTALDKPVELQVEEQVEGDAIVGRVIHELSLLPSSGPGSDRPPMTIEQLVKDQNLPSERPDYVALASRIWETEDEIAEFDKHLAEIRRADSD